MQSEIVAQRQKARSVEQTTCCIVGGGPAGAMLALLLARQGVTVQLLEAHGDFNRDFRGDTVHPLVLTILDELGLAERLLEIPHTKLDNLSAQIASGTITFANFERLKTRSKFPYIAMIPQVKFLEFITNEAKQYPEFHLVMGAQVEELIEEDGKVCGVLYHGHDGLHEMRAILTIGADGRFSRIRKLAGFEPIKTSPPMDILWFRLTRKPSDPAMTFARFGQQQLFAIINRDDYWQIGYIIPKGHYQQVRAQGLEHLQQAIAISIPELADRVHEVHEWKQVAVLSVESSRIPCWSRPGLLLIGDAAHVMSPVGGVGINYAIQDAVVASNILGGKLKYGILEAHDLAEVQRQRQLPTVVIQAFQRLIQKGVFANALNSDKPFKPPLAMRLIAGTPILRDMPARILAFGIWPVHVKA